MPILETIFDGLWTPIGKGNTANSLTAWVFHFVGVHAIITSMWGRLTDHK